MSERGLDDERAAAQVVALGRGRRWIGVNQTPSLSSVSNVVALGCLMWLDAVGAWKLTISMSC